jgi:hypothetical protein
MAKVIIGAEVKVDGLDKAGQSVGNIKKQLADAKKELYSAIEGFGEFSNEAANAAKKVEGLKGTIDDAARLVKTFDGDAKFNALSGALNAVVGGFSALTGAMGLLGTESKEIEKLLLKVQSAMALSQGLNSVLEGAKGFKDLGLVIKSTTAFQKIFTAGTAIAATVQKAFGVAVDTTSKGFKALRTAIISTGIGALVVLIGVVISKISDWVSGTDDLEASQKRLKKSIEETTAATERNIRANNRSTTEAIALAKSQGKSESELFEIKKKGALEEERLLGVKLRRQYDFYNTQKELFDKGKIDEEEYLSAKKTYNDSYFDYETFKSNQRIEQYNEEGRIRQAATAAANAAAETKRGENEKEKERLKKQKEELAALRVEYEQKEKDGVAAYVADFVATDEKNAEDDRTRLRRQQEDTLAVKAELAELALLNDPDSIDNKLAKMQADFDLEMIQFEGTELQRQIKVKEFSNAIVAIKAEEAEAKKQIGEKELEYQNTLASGIANSLDTLAGIAGKQTAAGKALAIASTVIKTIQGGIAAFTGMTSSIPGPVGIALGVVAAAGVVAAGVKAVKQITAVKIPGASGGGSAPSISLPTAAPLTPQAQTTRLDQGSINAVGNAANRAYVLETDVSGNQERIRRLNRAARIN